MVNVMLHNDQGLLLYNIIIHIVYLGLFIASLHFTLLVKFSKWYCVFWNIEIHLLSMLNNRVEYMYIFLQVSLNLYNIVHV